MIFLNEHKYVNEIDEIELLHSIEVVENKKQIVSYLETNRCVKAIDVDAIDISGYVLASPEWRNYCERNTLPAGRWRVALLKPGSKGAEVRAKESTVWRGDLEKLNQNIEERSARIVTLAKDIGADLEIRYYESIPITRYMKVDQTVFESYYPADRTGADINILVLPRDCILRKRVEKEFDVLWNLLN